MTNLNSIYLAPGFMLDVPFLGGPQINPIFIPRKHTKMTYRAQQRAAQKRKRSK